MKYFLGFEKDWFEDRTIELFDVEFTLANSIFP